MQNLSDIESIKKIDPQNTLASTDMLAEQCQLAWTEANAITLSQEISDIKNIVCCGMGASVYGALVTRALAGSGLKYPLETISDYHLPEYVNSETLVILTSYSGTTEEVLSCAKEAKEKGAQMIVLTKGGPLADFAKANYLPAYIFDGKLNPAGIPRLGNGYTIIGLLGLLHKTGVIPLPTSLITEALEFLKKQKDVLKQKAMTDAKQFVGKLPVIFAAEHLAGNAHILRNQFNETSKTFSSFFLVPDLNHHLMEGLQFPAPSNLLFILLQSNNYSEKIKKRMNLTKEVVAKNKQMQIDFVPSGTSIYSDFLEVMVYGSYLTLYLGLLYDQNPAINPWVDYFKQQLASSS